MRKRCGGYCIGRRRSLRTLISFSSRRYRKESVASNIFHKPLYKAVREFSSLQTALVAFSSFIGHDEVVSETAGVVRFDNKYKERLDSRYAELKRVSVDVIERLQAFDIISPRSLRPFLTPPEEWVNTVESGFVDLKNKTTPEQASSLRAIILRVAQNMFVWKDHIFPCIDNILSTGQPITDSGIAVCNIPSPDDWGRSTN